MESITIHGKALEGNLERDAVDRAPLAFIDQYIQNLRQYRAIAIDVGDEDNLKVDTGKLHDVLTSYGITHDFEVYPGTHTSHVAVRFQEHVIPSFSRTLSFDIGKR